LSKRWVLLGLVFCLGLSCTKEESDENEGINTSSVLVIPEGFPSMEFPEDNPFTVASYELGKKLFFDPILSRDSSISCGSCHLPGKAFSDEFSVSLGVDGAAGTRNSPSLANVGYHPYFMREGGVPTLEMQVLVPIQEHNEFDFNIVLIAERLNQHPEYVKMSLEAYDRSPDPFTITRSISNFQRTLISGNSAYDQFALQGNTIALNLSEKRGMDLFFSDELACGSCHADFNFTDYSFGNNGLYAAYLDEGRRLLTGLESDRALFKVPSLRNVELTGPYMHDGSMASLQEVILHYESGGEDHPNKSEQIQGFELDESERADLLAFLNSLTDTEFITNPNHSQ
jgi:cytochrome c peroxidase